MRKVPLRLDAPSVRSPEIVIPSAGALSTTLQSVRCGSTVLGPESFRGGCSFGTACTVLPSSRGEATTGRILAQVFSYAIVHREFRLTLDPLLRPDPRNANWSLYGNLSEPLPQERPAH